jgi:hypothetical protein
VRLKGDAVWIYVIVVIAEQIRSLFYGMFDLTDDLTAARQKFGLAPVIGSLVNLPSHRDGS